MYLFKKLSANFTVDNNRRYSIKSIDLLNISIYIMKIAYCDIRSSIPAVKLAVVATLP